MCKNRHPELVLKQDGTTFGNLPFKMPMGLLFTILIIHSALGLDLTTAHTGLDLTTRLENW